MQSVNWGAATTQAGNRAHGVARMVMEREEEGRQLVEAARKVEAEAKAAREKAAIEAKAAKERAAIEAKAAAREAKAVRTSEFRGPYKDCCCSSCVSADGSKLYGCVPTSYNYFLPLGLHTCLCPQQGGNPCPVRGIPHGVPSSRDACCDNVAGFLMANAFLGCIQVGMVRGATDIFQDV